ncbi:hypothetical protein D6D01_09734 [Aureobasidium pullulans]|uniref:Uncharacterized protein n=1 Tax=Aureobasidium pullulans TaxID=5580 RepID=A0A4S9JXS9_AURPU|nr:hypothetical protein D6D01_09734 [Aureobasidium pullulans]
MGQSLIQSQVWNHDPEDYATPKYDEGFIHVISDGEVPLVNTNYPPGHTHFPWTVEDVRSDLANDINSSKRSHPSVRKRIYSQSASST